MPTDISVLSSLFGQAENEAQRKVGMFTGGLQALAGKAIEQKAKQKFPALEDPAEQRLQAELEQKQRTFESGTAYKTAFDELAETTKSINRGILKTSGGNIGLAIRGQAGTARAAGSAINKLFQESQGNIRFYQQLRGNLINKMAQRKMELELSQYDQLMADARSLQKTGMSNLMAGIGFGGQGGQAAVNPFDFGPAAQASAPTSPFLGGNVAGDTGYVPPDTATVNPPLTGRLPGQRSLIPY